MNLSNLLKTLAAVSVFSLLVACGNNENATTEAEVASDTEATTNDMTLETATLAMDTADQKISYAIGFQMANRYKTDPILSLDKELLIKGINDALEGNESAVSEQDTQAASQEMQERHQNQQAVETEKAQSNGKAFLEENKAKTGVTTTESGLQYEVLTKGDSDKSPVATDSVKVHYHGTLVNGTVFDSSVDRGEPISFALNGVIKGWTEGLQLMSIGDKFRFFIPSDLGYGARAAGSIPPHSTLIFDVELLGINEE